jgi:hypothetical protein
MENAEKAMWRKTAEVHNQVVFGRRTALCRTRSGSDTPVHYVVTPHTLIRVRRTRSSHTPETAVLAPRGTTPRGGVRAR